MNSLRREKLLRFFQPLQHLQADVIIKCFENCFCIHKLIISIIRDMSRRFSRSEKKNYFLSDNISPASVITIPIPAASVIFSFSIKTDETTVTTGVR